jgi:hypothetical protein
VKECSDYVCSPKKRELMKDTPVLDRQTLFVRPVKIGKQLTIDIAIEDIRTKKNISTIALVDSGCMRTCIDETFARNSGLALTKILKPIKVEYTDGTSVEDSTIQYSTDLRTRAAGATIVTGALVTRLKSAKVFLGFDWLQSVNPRIDWRTFRVEADGRTDSLKMRYTDTCSEERETSHRIEAEEGTETPERRSTDTCSEEWETSHRVEAEEGTETPKRRSTDETPDYLTIYEKVFSEEAFNSLPPQRKWDHAINLVLGHSPVRG